MELYSKDMLGYVSVKSYVNGVSDGIALTVGSYIVYRIGKFLVKGYINYQVEKKAKEEDR